MTPLNILFLLAFVVVMFLMMRKGGGCCGDHGHDDHSGHSHGEGQQDQQAGTAKDPVCGMTVENPTLTGEHQGKKYAFCSKGCQENFAADPGKYV